MRKLYWRDMKRDDFADPSIQDAIAVLPIAAIEQHGPHLPTGTDAILAQGYIDHIAKTIPDDLPLIFLPTQEIGWSEEHLGGIGTLTSTWKHLLPYWMDILLSVKRAGISKLIIINSHGGNVPIMDILIQDLRTHHNMLASSTNWLRFGYPDGLFSEEEIAFGIHGGDVETSMMLHLAPDLVARDQMINFPSLQQELAETHTHLRAYGRKQLGWMATDLNPQGVVGNASKATSEKGEQLIAHICAGFLDYARELHQFDAIPR